MSSLKALKEKFDKVYIKYTDKSCDVMLVDGLNIFTGRAQCHIDDNFDKKLGRTIALGRAEFRHKVKHGVKSPRPARILNGGFFSSDTILCDSEEFVDRCITYFLPKRLDKNKET